MSGAALGGSGAERDLLRGIAALPPGLRRGADDLAVADRAAPAETSVKTTPGHDGLLRQTTQTAETERTVFDCRRGRLVRKVCTKTITLSLTMTNRGRRGSDDFGHVVPSSQVVQTLTVERRTDRP